jgi:hypothetical protein
MNHEQNIYVYIHFVRYVDIGQIIDHHCLNFIYIICLEDQIRLLKVNFFTFDIINIINI